MKSPSGVGTQFEFRGNVYPTLKDACETTGIAPATASYRLSAGWDIETALDPDTDVDNRKSITIDGVFYPTLSDAAREFDIVEVTFMKRLRSDWTPEQAAGIDPPPEFKRGSDPIPREEYIERLHLVHGDSLDFTHSDFNRAQDKVEVMSFPPKTGSGYRLGQRVSVQRSRRNQLTRERRELLDGLGFEWRVKT